MTTVRIEVLDPLDPHCRDDLRELLARHGAGPDWAGRFFDDLGPTLLEPYGAFLRAEDETAAGTMLGAGLLLSRREPGEARARPWFAALWVRPELRGRGLGRKLAQMAERQAREAGAEEILLTVQPEDDTSLFTAERWGYFRETLVLSKSLV